MYSTSKELCLNVTHAFKNHIQDVCNFVNL